MYVINFPLSSTIIQYHPISSNIIQYHPLSSIIIHIFQPLLTHNYSTGLPPCPRPLAHSNTISFSWEVAWPIHRFLVDSKCSLQPVQPCLSGSRWIHFPSRTCRKKMWQETQKTQSTSSLIVFPSWKKWCFGQTSGDSGSDLTYHILSLKLVKTSLKKLFQQREKTCWFPCLVKSPTSPDVTCYQISLWDSSDSSYTDTVLPDFVRDNITIIPYNPKNNSHISIDFHTLSIAFLEFPPSPWVLNIATENLSPLVVLQRPRRPTSPSCWAWPWDRKAGWKGWNKSLEMMYWYGQV